MMSGSDTVLFSLYVCLLGVLSLFAVHRLRLALAAGRMQKVRAVPPPEWPCVLVQLPLYNERYVAERLIDAVAALDYPADRLSIQVLDDSTDDTTAVVAGRVAALRERGVAVEHVRRGSRAGFKAGALAAGLERADAELVAIFDADFVPPADFLARVVPYFNDQRIGMVQARWDHLNRDQSALTRAQAALLDGHFANEHGGRFARRCYFNFNGTAGVWRRACIDAAGGWLSRTLTEDLDLSYRAQLAGWRFLYAPDIVVPAEIPADVDSFKSQQHRWAQGAVETAKFLLPEIWRRPSVPLRCRLEASFHLLGNLAYPLVILFALMMPLVATINAPIPGWLWNVMDAGLLFGSTGSLVAFYLLALRRVGGRPADLATLPMTLALGAGLAINNTIAIVDAFLKRSQLFTRTPKLGGRDPGEVAASYVPHAGGMMQALLEIALGLYVVFAAVLTGLGGRMLTVPFLAIFASGFLLLGVGSLRSRFSGNALTASALPKRT
jgi:cellulose synthase/poly-beta-1,6-N-acetylglucosamine synthase-like glycosyltransferase